MNEREFEIWDFIREHLQIEMEQDNYHHTVNIKVALVDYPIAHEYAGKYEVISECTFDVGESK